MKLVIPNRIDELWRKGFLPNLAKKLDVARVLTTKEQVTANTNAANVASAVVVGDLINNLSGCNLVTEGSGANTKYYIQKGADTASKKLLGSGKTHVLSAGSANGTLSYSVNVSNISGYKSFTANNFRVTYALYSALSNTLSGVNVSVSTPAYNAATGILTGTITVRNGNNTAIQNNVQVTGTVFVSPGGFT